MTALKNTLTSLLVGTTLVLASCGNETYYEKHVSFPANATAEQKIDMASRLVPSARQLAWQELEMTAFLHFGINTFTGREWGDGSEDPAIFNPEKLDADQWVKALKDGGFKLVIITAKHHDGFCLWPTATTKHSVASSLWRDGKGDVVKELREACDKYGMKFGVYLSPWDRNAECYGDSPAYNDFFVQQLTELLTNYGEVHEVWFDGACAEGPNGKQQVYDWARYYDVIHKLQPNAVTAIMGDDVRWVGNEKGLGRECEWSATVLPPGGYANADSIKNALGLKETGADLGSRELVAKASEMFWYPSEVDVSIRPGWFYHPEQDSEVKSLAKLVDIYYESVGRNSVLLLNIPPNTDGLLCEIDVQRIKELNEYITKNFANDLLTTFTPASVEKGGEVVCELPQATKVNSITIQEDITKGQRVESFTVSAMVDGNWVEVGSGSTIGYKRMLRFPAVNATALKLTVNETRNTANIKKISAYCVEELTAAYEGETVSDIQVDKWTVKSATGGTAGAKAAIDGDVTTVWRSASDKKPMIEVDMGSVVDNVTGFAYLPTEKDGKAGTVYYYNFYVSTDGKKWTQVKKNAEFGNIMHNTVLQKVTFDKPCSARYFRFESTREIEQRDFITIAELGILVKK